MRRRLAVGLLLGVLLVAGATGRALAATPVSVEDLLARPERFAGETITLEGELVGDYGFRRDGWMWTQLDDDAYARAPLREGGELAGANVGVGIRMPVVMARDLDPPGGYRRRGPLVQVTGTWRFHDPGRRGESYLDVAALQVVEPGRLLTEGPAPVPTLLGLLLVLVAAGLWWSYRGVRDEA